MQQEVSKPVMIAIIAVAVIAIGLVGWYFLGRPQTYPGYQAPPGQGSAGPGMPGMVPGQAPGGQMPGQAPGQMPGQAPGGPPGPR